MMNTKSAGRLLTAGFFSALLLAGCSRRNEATVGTPVNPLVLVFSPAHAPVLNALAFVKHHIESSTGMSVEFKLARTPVETVREFSTGRTDAGLVTLEEYLAAREEYGVRAIAQVLRGDRLEEYEGVILTRAKDGIRSVADLSGRKAGFVGPYSVSGFTLPSLFLKQAGVKAIPDFSAGHEAVLRKLINGEIAAAATYARQASRQPGLKVLAVTGKAPNEPVIVRGKLRPEKRALLISALLSLGSTKEGRKALSEIADITGFQQVDEAVYKPLHELIRTEGKTVYDLLPDGWDIYRLSRPYYPSELRL